MSEKQGFAAKLLPWVICAAEVVLYCFWFLLSQLIVSFLLAVPYAFAKSTVLLKEGLDSLQASQELLRLFNEEFLPVHTPWISLLSALLAVGVLIPLLKKFRPPWKEELRLKKPSLGSLLPVAPLAVALQIFISLALSLVMLIPSLGVFSQQMEEYSSLVAGGSNKWVELLAVAVAAPLCEEIFFRGAVLSSLKRTKMPLWLAITLQAALFGLIHGLPLQMAYAFLLGLLLGFLTEKFHCLWHSVLLHALFNAAGYWTQLLSDSPSLWLFGALLILSAVIAVLSLRELFFKSKECEKGEDHAT